MAVGTRDYGAAQTAKAVTLASTTVLAATVTVQPLMFPAGTLGWEAMTTAIELLSPGSTGPGRS